MYKSLSKLNQKINFTEYIMLYYCTIKLFTLSETHKNATEIFKPNAASMNAQKIHQYDELKIELWCDKHYFDRITYGDSDGAREGIEVDGVRTVIIESFKYLLDIFLRGIPFKFINYFDKNNPKKPPLRTIIRKVIGGNYLNVVAEIHYLEASKFEITVITAMVTDNFRVGDGQYTITLSDGKAVLRRKIRTEMHDIYKLDL